jgi:hypothetical protein
MSEQANLKESAIAGKWWSERYCKHCNATVSCEEWRTQICLSCGTFDRMMILRSERASRKYFNGEKWVIQHRDQNGAISYSPCPPEIPKPATTEQVGSPPEHETPNLLPFFAGLIVGIAVTLIITI